MENSHFFSFSHEKVKNVARWKPSPQKKENFFQTQTGERESVFHSIWGEGGDKTRFLYKLRSKYIPFHFGVGNRKRFFADSEHCWETESMFHFQEWEFSEDLFLRFPYVSVAQRTNSRMANLSEQLVQMSHRPPFIKRSSFPEVTSSFVCLFAGQFR